MMHAPPVCRIGLAESCITPRWNDSVVRTNHLDAATLCRKLSPAGAYSLCSLHQLTKGMCCNAGHRLDHAHVWAFDSCNGKMPAQGAVRHNAKSLPALLENYSVSSELDWREILNPPRSPSHHSRVGAFARRSNASRKHGARLAMEISGCMRHLDMYHEAKARQVHAAVASGLRVSIFCYLEACNDEQVARAQAGAILRFERALQSAGAELCNCSWVPWTDQPWKRAKDLLANPNSSHPLLLKLQRVQQLRLEYEAKQVQHVRHRHDFVWRTRPDWESTHAINWGMVHELGTSEYLVPQCRTGVHVDLGAGCGNCDVPSTRPPQRMAACTRHSDVDAILPVLGGAADHYDSTWSHIDWLCLHGLGPGDTEGMLGANMGLLGFTAIALPGWLPRPIVRAGLPGQHTTREVGEATDYPAAQPRPIDSTRLP